MADVLSDKEIRDNLPTETRDIYSKYMESFYFLQPRKRRQANQIALLNNLQRGDENIASTLLLTLFNRIMSNLYDDKIQVKFVPNEEIEQKQVQSLNILAQNDYQQMNMKQLDYDWTWDTLFFGRGYMETLRFDTTRKIMQPHVINPLSFGYDPFFENPQQWRYYWKWITKSKVEINTLLKAGIVKNITKAEDLPSGVDPFLWNYKIIRERAKGVTPQASDSYQGDIYQILEFFGYNANGEKCVYWLDRDFSKILYEQVLDLKDGDDIVGPGNEVVQTTSRWPIVVKEAFREPHASVVFSVADLLEDKHRARSVLLNLAFLAAKDKANPLYQYNPDKVKDVTQLFSRQINQHIPVESVTDAIAPLNTDSAMDPSLQAFMQMLNQEASDPIGTNVQAAPQPNGKQTATEAAIQQQLSDLAQSLQSKVMQFGVEEFWSAWYYRYKRFTKAGDEKIATIVGVKGVTFEKIDLGSIQTKFPPGVIIFSAKEAEYKDLVERRDLMEMYPSFQASMTPDGMRNFNKYVFFPKFLKDPSMMEILFPDTLDELKAQDENEILNTGAMSQVANTDNHEQHLMVHRMAKNTWGKWLHIDWHEKLLSKQKEQMLAQQSLMQQGAGLGQAELPPEPLQPQVGVAKQSPMQAASSLRQETQKSIQQNPITK
jgi:preprotein translocase subunit YajC